MTKNNLSTAPEWDDDDALPWTAEEWDRAEFSIGNVVIRPGRDRDGNPLPRMNPLPPGPGRPPERDKPKRQVTLRLDADVVERFRASGRGWQSRINAALREVVGL